MSKLNLLMLWRDYEIKRKRQEAGDARPVRSKEQIQAPRNYQGVDETICKGYETMKKLLCVLILALCAGAAENNNGWTDTAIVAAFNSTDLAYTKAFDLGSGEDLAVVIKCNDTSSAGFVADSINFKWGYQLGTPIPRATGRIVDTLYSPVIWVDSVTTANLGKRTAGYQDSSLVTHTVKGWVDTSMISGWACQASGILPEFSPLIRYAFQGVTGNKVESFVKLQVQQVRRLYVAVRNK